MQNQEQHICKHPTRGGRAGITIKQPLTAHTTPEQLSDELRQGGGVVLQRGSSRGEKCAPSAELIKLHLQLRIILVLMVRFFRCLHQPLRGGNPVRMAMLGGRGEVGGLDLKAMHVSLLSSVKMHLNCW
ncbi:hypothetical protein EYF80_004161 [Liparis tanakae]|uniref:Uncharacterized protein n=1 Tax=Liparis tanakae TaxID=230148 RepID=A0A4Z2J774_9TELE|nr:hypothetical protein EYF80_004161 [Liparis tanakae]